MSKTVSDAYGYAQDLLKFEGGTVGIPGQEEDRAIQWANDLNEQYFLEFEERGVNFPDYMRKETGFTASPETALADDAVAGANTLTIDSSSALDSSGAGVIWKNYQFDIFTFAGNVSGNVSGVSGIDFDHSEGEAVGKLHALPSDYYKPRRIDTFDGVRVDGAGYSRGQEPGPRTFALYEDSGTKYLWLPRYTTGDVSVVYDRKPTTLTTTDGATGTLDMQGKDFWYVVYGLLALFRQVQDEEYVPNKETAQMQGIVNKAIAKRSVGRQLSVAGAYFNRPGMTRSAPSFPYNFSA